MKKFVHAAERAVKVLYKILPFFLGIYCYYPVFRTQGERIYPFLDAIYASLKLYSGVTESGVPVGALLQLARFMALVATLSILIGALQKMNDLVNRLKLLSGGATVVYGDSPFADRVYADLAKRSRIRGEDKPIPNAARYLIMYSSDESSLGFYGKNHETLKGKRVYLMLDSVSPQNVDDPLITVFSPAENCARQYWRAYPPDRSERIALIGFGNVGKKLLLYGLQLNILDPVGGFKYHIYGDGADFRRVYTELDQMSPDEIVFYDGGVTDFSALADYDRVILADGGEENLSVLSKLFAAAPIGRVYVYTPSGDIVTELFGRERVTCFGTADETASADMILNERLLESAKAQHEAYREKYGGEPWERLSAFRRYSNISSADYAPVIERLAAKGVPPETIAELEHIRWCRYHYLNNWRYGETTDTARRVHNCLIPFADLSAEEKAKDVEAIKNRRKG
ncbi:MAG: RyR domain-containing protein [Bacteroides sp.]|nr:RyR domain-containing protein [Eubacterium sp.]MCM1419664.1 RyR domain-containing protein [Roseburia sp.]MCM1463633.1 RyR domain-containing protein [Bacteroides sp.]